MTRPDLATAAGLLDRLRLGDTPAQAGQALNLSPLELVLALGVAGPGSDDPSYWPGLTHSRPARPWLAPALGEDAWTEVFPRAVRPARLALTAGLLQIHDFWTSSHEAAQQAGDLGERGHSAFWHGIAHRREPDAGNAAYWFRRVGQHQVFGRLANEARPLLEAHGDSGLTRSLLASDSWNPLAFIDLCTSARSGSDRSRLALQLQRLEMLALLEATVPTS